MLICIPDMSARFRALADCRQMLDLGMSGVVAGFTPGASDRSGGDRAEDTGRKAVPGELLSQGRHRGRKSGGKSAGRKIYGAM